MDLGELFSSATSILDQAAQVVDKGVSIFEDTKERVLQTTVPVQNIQQQTPVAESINNPDTFVGPLPPPDLWLRNNKALIILGLVALIFLKGR